MPADDHQQDSSVDALVSSASRWMRQTLIGWADDDYAVVAMLAPISVEHLGKAALWRRNPALLVPLTANAEESLRLLTGKPDLAHPRLRTIGLALVMERLEKYLDPFPLVKDAVRALVDVRNGSVHVAAKGTSRDVLVAALSLCEVLLADVGIDTSEFYGDQDGNVRGLLTVQRTKVEAVAAAKMARARNHLSTLEEKLGSDLFQETMTRLEDDARFVVDPHDFSSFWDTVAIDRTCPECGSKGRLVGRLDADPEPDWEVGDEGESYVAGMSWELSFAPHVFVCNVCKLELLGPGELGAAAVPSASLRLEPSDLDDDFDFDDYVRTIYRDRD